MTAPRAASLSDPILYAPGTAFNLNVTFPEAYDLSGKWFTFEVRKTKTGSVLFTLNESDGELTISTQTASIIVNPDSDGGVTFSSLTKQDSTLHFSADFGDDSDTDLVEYRIQGDISVLPEQGEFSGTGTATSTTVSFESSTVSVTLAGQGPKGDDGAAGPGLPAGGTVGQIPTKASATDYDVAWTNAGAGDMIAANNLSELTDAAAARTNLGLGTAATSDTGDFATAAQGTTADTAIQPADISGLTGGTTGQIATKASGDDYDLTWSDDLTVAGLLTANHIHGNIAGTLYIHVKNTSGGTLAKGTPVYVTGHVGSSDRVEVAAADQSDPAKMPAIALLAEELANNGQGDGVIVGEIRTFDTDTPGYALNDELFVGTGALTDTKPTTGAVQPVATVGRLQSSTGVLVINCQGQRSPDETFAPALGADDNYVTDAEKVVIGNTSGTNTGDQDLSGYALTSSLGTAAASDTGDFEASGAVSTHAAITSGVHGISTFGASLIDDADAATARTTLGVDTAGTDNSTDVTLAGSLDYLSLSGQEITMGSVDLTTDVTGTLPAANGGTGVTALTSLNLNTLGSGAATDGYVATADGAGGVAWEATATEIGIACSDETTDLAAATGVATFRMPYAMTLTGIRASVTTASVGSSIIVDVNESGSTILSTKLSIDASEKTSETAATSAVISDSALADDAEITVDIDQVGSTTAGAGLKIWLIGTRA